MKKQIKKKKDLEKKAKFVFFWNVLLNILKMLNNLLKFLFVNTPYMTKSLEENAVVSLTHITVIH